MTIAASEQVRPASQDWVLGGLTAFAFAALANFALQAVGLAYSLLFGFQGFADEFGATEFTFNRARMAVFQDVLPLLLASLAISGVCLAVIARRFGLRAALEQRAITRAAILLVPALAASGLLSLGVAHLWTRSF